MSDVERSNSSRLEEAVLAKIQWRLIPFLGILYVFCLLDRNNVGIAALTMQKDLGFDNRIYGTGAGIFFWGYFLFEVPANLIMEKVGARKWMARIMFTWGLVSVAMMFVKSPLSFYTLRFLLGVAEAGFFPGVMLYLTYWVPAKHRARVLSRFLAVTAILGLAGNPLGSVLLKLDDLQGLQGWQWLFLIEGIPSVLLAFVVWKLLPDSPRQSRWLTDDEKQWLDDALAHDVKTQDRVPHFNLKTLVTEPRILFLCLIFILNSTAGNAVGFFGPKLLQAKSSGAWPDWVISLILMIPAVVGAIAMWLAAYHSDKTGNRRLHVYGGYFVGGLGFLLCAFVPSAWGVVFALSVQALGERVAAGSYWAVTTNLLGAGAAAGGLAFINSVGNLGGFFGPKLMGELLERNNGAFTPGLLTAAALITGASLLAYFTMRRTDSKT